jgi:hypothetical protein
VEIDTLGKKVVGRIVNLNGDKLSWSTPIAQPERQVTVNRKKRRSLRPSKLG